LKHHRSRRLRRGKEEAAASDEDGSDDDHEEGSKQTHRLRGTKLLQRHMPLDQADNWQHGTLEPPIKADQIIDRVHIVHSCRRICDVHRHGNCWCHTNCCVRSVCQRHELPNCPDSSCRNTVKVSWHNPDRDLYEVLSQAEGISFERRRLGWYENR
jgi:hypothetical protein